MYQRLMKTLGEWTLRESTVNVKKKTGIGVLEISESVTRCQNPNDNREDF